MLPVSNKALCLYPPKNNGNNFVTAWLYIPNLLKVSLCKTSANTLTNTRYRDHHSTTRHSVRIRHTKTCHSIEVALFYRFLPCFHQSVRQLCPQFKPLTEHPDHDRCTRHCVLRPWPVYKSVTEHSDHGHSTHH